MNSKQRVVVYFLLWFGLIAFGLMQRSRISAMQSQVDDDLSVLARRRESMQLRIESILSRAKSLAAREEALKKSSRSSESSACCADKLRCEEGLGKAHEQVKSLLAELQILKAAKKAIPPVPPTTVATTIAVMEEAPERQIVPIMPPDSEAQYENHIPSGEHHHGAHLSKDHLDGFSVDAKAAAPAFLEEEAHLWSFSRDTKHDSGFLNLMPWPQEVTFDKVFVGIGGGVLTVDWADGGPFGTAASERLQKRLKAVSDGLGGSVCPHARLCEWKTAVPVHITVNCASPPPASGNWVPTAKAKEDYELRIDMYGQTVIKASEPAGVVRAFATLVQLVTVEHKRPFFPVVTITDHPGYAWRGILLDVARNFHPVAQVMSLLDGMEQVKLNVLHWHLSDDQGFRLQSTAFPLLTTKGAAPGEFYTQTEVKQIVQEAALRGIRVVPEVDMPAHVGAILLGYPELAGGGKAPSGPVSKWGVHPYCLDPSKPEVYAWINTFLGEMESLFPDEYYHIGGDEVPSKAWTDGAIKSWMQKEKIPSRHGVQLHFNKQLVGLLAKRGRKMVGWDEITVEWLPKNVTVQFWRSWEPSVLRMAESLGLDIITSAEMYLDWVRPIKHYYQHNIRPSKGRVGAEACMWSEWAQTNIDNRLWPTLAPIAEKFWLTHEAHGGTSQMYARLWSISRTLAATGLPHEAVYTRALHALITSSSFPYSALREPLSATELTALAPVRRLCNTMQPLNRVGGTDPGQRHELTELVDVLRPDSLEMRALAALIDTVVRERFEDATRVGLLRASLLHYVNLETDFKAPLLASAPLLAPAKPILVIVVRIARAAVALLDALAGADAPLATRLKNELLRDISSAENQVIGSAKVIVEFAHVIETSLCVRI